MTSLPNNTEELIDRHVGQRLKQRRMEIGYSQERLAMLIGVTFQQIQKYEKGVNRISASRLFEISKILQVPIVFFYEGLPTPSGSIENNLSPNLYPNDKLAHQLMEAFSQIQSVDVKQSLVVLAQNLTQQGLNIDNDNTYGPILHKDYHKGQRS